MLGKLADRNQCEIFRTRLADLINPQHELALCASKKGRFVLNQRGRFDLGIIQNFG